MLGATGSECQQGPEDSRRKLQGHPLGNLDLSIRPSAQTSAKASSAHDEVAAVLQGLQLDRHFFFSRLRQDTLKELTPAPPLDGMRSPTRRKSAPSKLKRQQTRVNTSGSQKPADFDIYLNEALMPALAQSLDALVRQVERMEKQGDKLDPKVRARFNPVTWLAQQLLRHHPRCARTPRRQTIYNNFKTWGDLERGRRAMLRKKKDVQHVFEGFVLAQNAGSVQLETLPQILDAIDDTLHLEGVLKNNKILQQALGGSPTPKGLSSVASPVSKSSSLSRSLTAKSKAAFFQGDLWNFDRFWYVFANIIINNDVVPYSAIKQGMEALDRQDEARAELEEAQNREREEKLKKEAEQRQIMASYAELHERMTSDEHILSILNDDKILTGDDVRPTDPGFEFEVPPKGPHVKCIADFLTLLGFPKLERPEVEAEIRYYDAELANAWAILQDIYHTELADGVVEKVTLQQVLVPPVGFMVLKHKVEDELDKFGQLGDREQIRPLSSEAVYGELTKPKPSMEALCKNLGMPIARMHWLHQVFQGFLEPLKGEATPPICNYPEAPAAIPKRQMAELMREVNPALPEEEFEARFQRIDRDASNGIEFDEFVTWVRQDEVKLSRNPNQKMGLEELATFHNLPLETVKYLYNCFQDQLPEGLEDGYPFKPVHLPKDELLVLINSLTPHVTQDEFEDAYEIVNNNSGHDGLVFDDFLDVLEFDELPEELVGSGQDQP